MRRFFLLTGTACWLLACSGCSSPQNDATDQDETPLQSDNAELAELHQQDQAEAFRVKESTTLDNSWRPSADAREILDRSEIDRDFIDEVIPDFILYWPRR